jgi:hypothetical protein
LSDTRDENRFQTAWFYINENVTDKELNADLKRLLLRTYISGNKQGISFITPLNHANVTNLIQNMKNQKLKQEFLNKITTNVYKTDKKMDNTSPDTTRSPK